MRRAPATLPLIDSHGWLCEARHCPSPNFDARPETAIDLLVIHNISLPPGRFGTGLPEQLFTNSLDCTAHAELRDLEGLRVSAHVLIDRWGRLRQFVSFADRAWHAGASCFEARTSCNDFSIGIELEGTDHRPYTDSQYRRLATVARALMQRYPGILPQRIVGHQDIAPGRKTDPGPAFEWQRFRASLQADRDLAG